MINAFQELTQFQNARAEQDYRRRLSDLAERKFALESQMAPEQLQGQRLSNLAKQIAIQQIPQDRAMKLAQQNTQNQYLRDALAAKERMALANLKARSEALKGRPGQVIQSEEGMFERGADGSIKPIIDPATGKQLKAKGAEKPLTEFQGKSAGYGTRAQSAHDILNDLEGKYNVEGLALKRGLQDLPAIGGMAGFVGNMALSKEQQRAEQAQRDFINAVLRQESGAAISIGEFDNAAKQYFPQPGDTKDVIAQKKRNRELAIQGFERSAGKEGGEPIRRLREESAARRAGARSASGGLSSQEEQRYQELLRKQNAAQ